MDSTVSGPVSGDNSSVEFLPVWLLAAAVIGGLVVVANILICIIYIRRKQWCRSAQACRDNIWVVTLKYWMLSKKLSAYMIRAPLGIVKVNSSRSRLCDFKGDDSKEDSEMVAVFN
ncbi:nephrin [Caerostris extrusa]|uniref:Nephrin n=1 Tax=Caerostris extrusa TaxID=172846 RepID=A0AAV4WZS5_CAEEX|nr:nephrin [Caerostris extrusa]